MSGFSRRLVSVTLISPLVLWGFVVRCRAENYGDINVSTDVVDEQLSFSVKYDVPPPPTPNHIIMFPHQSYIVRRGDTLRKIADLVYGDREEWTRIYEVNKDYLGDKDSLESGQALLIP